MGYVIYDSEKEEVTFRRIPYALEETIRKIREANLPPLFGERLRVEV